MKSLLDNRVKKYTFKTFEMTQLSGPIRREAWRLHDTLLVIFVFYTKPMEQNDHLLLLVIIRHVCND